MLSINHTVIDTGTYEVEARIEVTPHAATGDGRHEPREAAHAECVLDMLLLTKQSWLRGEKVYTAQEVPCPDWLREIILEDAQDAADDAVREYFCELEDDAGDEADRRYDEAAE